MASNFDPSMFVAIIPELLILCLGLIILSLELVIPKEKRLILGWITAGGLGLILVLSLLVAFPGAEGRLVFGGMLRHDWLGFAFKMMFLFAAAITSLLIMDFEKLGKRGEIYLLLLASTLGMSLMASAADLIMLYLAIETTSIPLYVMAGFLTQDDKSTESGFKYFLFGAMTSAIMLYGFSLLYGFTGTTSIYSLREAIANSQLGFPAFIGTLLLILIGFGFKISIVPLHFWAPDVYEGAPTPVAGFLSTASKAAGFAVLMRVFIEVFPAAQPYWGTMFTVIATITMTMGNLLALAQKNLKRMLAYSSIAHAGYALIGIAVFSQLGLTSTIFYLVAYIVTNLAAFAVVSAFGRITGTDEIAAYAGLSRRSPYLALFMLVAFLSLAGMPPFGGFIIKFVVFAAAVEQGLIWLAVVGVLNSIIGLYYYLTVLKVVYLYRSEDEDKPLPIPRSYILVFAILALGILLIGTMFAPWLGLSTNAALSIAF